MEKSFTTNLVSKLTVLALVTMGINLSAQAPLLDFNLRYSTTLNRYEVYARPTLTQASFNWGPSQISVVTPASVPDMPFNITSVAGGAWQDNSLVFAPAAAPGSDFHGVGSLGAPTSFTANVEKLIFHFTLPGGGCTPGLRLYINGVDPSSAAAGMGGGDFTNTVFAIVPGVPGGYEAYQGNYDNGGTACNTPPSITSNGGGATAMVSVPENTTPVTTVTATDIDVPAQTLTYTITGGADQALFTINPMTGALSFITAPNFEVPGDAGMDNIYDVQVTVTDNGMPNLSDVQDIAVTVTDVNENPMITSNGAGPSAMISIPENTTPVTTVTSTDPDAGQTATYSITGGADAALFTIDPMTGALSFITAPDFENPTDAGANNVYDVQVTVTDNGTPNLTDVQDIAVTVTNGNDGPTITSNGGGNNAAVSVPENTTPVTTVTATDPDAGAVLTFTITGGADAALFTIDPMTGALSFITAPNFENPTDAGLNNVYDVQVTVTDNGTPGLTDVQNIAVTVTDVNENPMITSNGAGPSAMISVPENTTPVTTVTSMDPDAGQMATYSITGGADAALFTIDPMTGALSFITAPDFENPTDAGANNVYDVQVTVTDNGTPNLTDVQDIAVTVTNANEMPMITSNGGGATAMVSVPENTTPVTTVTASDPDAGSVFTYTITGGADAALFTIDPMTGALSFITAPNFENPTDAGLNNIYDVQVTVTDNGTPGLTDVQNIAVTVTDVNENPMITSNGAGPSAMISVPENTTPVTTVTSMDPDAGQMATYSITGGADAALFTIDPMTGALSFITAPDFENPTDAGANNVYDVQVTVTDNGTPNLTDVQDIAVTVTNGNDNPTITSNGGGNNAAVSVPENTTPVTTVTATDPDAGAVLTFTITGGADAALFTIDPMTGALSFITAPNFENPTDAGLNNVYDVQVTVTDNGTPGLTDVQNIAVTVTDVNENPMITSNGAGPSAMISVPENTTPVTTVTSMDPDAGQMATYSITGGADAALFTIDPMTGALSFITAPDFENPTDAGANNVYDVQVTVTDNGTPNLTDVQDIAVTVTNGNDNPMITSNGGGNNAAVSVPENTTPVTTVTATDPDAGAVLTFTITGGADAALFTIDPMTGALSFITAPNFENPTDAGLNNVYDVQVTVTDNGTPGLTDVQNIAVTVTDVNENPMITSNGAGPSAMISVPENTTPVTTVTSMDPDAGQMATYSITGGADAALFTIDPMTGALSFITAPDFENPTDAGANNVYDVQVTVTDNGTPNLTDVQDIAVTVTNGNETPVITSNGGGNNATVSVPENTTPVTTVTATDPDAGSTFTFTITGGADAALFTIDPMTGALSFITAPNFEVPTDAGANNVYDVQVTVTDNGTPALTDVQNIAVTVTDVNEAPAITSNGGGVSASVSIPENTTAVTTVTSIDPDAGQTPTYSITGGADAALFTINPMTGALSFITAPDFENPTDAGANNVYDVQVTVTDNGTPNLTDVQDIAVTVTNANDNPMITSNGGGNNAAVSVPENTTPVTTVTATDPDAGAVLTYSISGGADAALFTIDPMTGALSFITAPNFENPTDAGLNNVYDVQVTVTDNGTPGLTDVQNIAVTVTDVNENPMITSNGAGPSAMISVPENTTPVTTVTSMDPDAGQTATYSITGGADAALFTINPMTGALSFITAPDFENPTDAGANNVYDVQVTVTDNGTPNLTDVQDIAVTVINGNENPVITSNGGGNNASVSVPENTTPVTTVTATDPDAGSTFTYSITGGADAALFTIDPMTGALSFITAPNFEVPTDAGANNVYDVQVTVTDNGTPGLTDVQSIAVTVTDVNEAPVITSNGGGVNASVSIPENTTPVTTVTSTDPDAGQALTYTITGGADAAFFTINPMTGALSFITAPNFENPQDAGANNVYDVQVTVTDNGTPTLNDVQNIAVTITDVNENGVLAAKAMLQGALLGTSNGLMRDDLRTGNYIPLTEPYTALANIRFTHAGGGGGETTTPAVLAANAGTGNAIVDWVFVELRNASNPSVIVATRSALIQRDGDIVNSSDGINPLSFTGLAGQQYYVAVKHRNHLSIMTASAVTLTTGGVVVDFTTTTNAQVYNKPIGPNMVDYDGFEMVTVQGLRAMWAGNTTADIKVKYQGSSSDNTQILAQVLSFPGNISSSYNYNNALGYFSGDVNMDGRVKYQGATNDPSFIFANVVGLYGLNTSALYNYDLFIEQLPD